MYVADEVFPAWAGVNLGSLAHPISPSCIPRMGGGEPYPDTADEGSDKYSPHGRG